MPSLSKRILEHAAALPEATPLCPGALLHLGNRAAIDQALSRLARAAMTARPAAAGQHRSRMAVAAVSRPAGRTQGRRPAAGAPPAFAPRWLRSSLGRPILDARRGARVRDFKLQQ